MIRRTLPAVLLCSTLALTGCGGGEETDSSSNAAASSTSSSSAAAPSSKAPTSSPAPAPQATPQQLFIEEVEAAGIVPAHGTEADVIELATTICVAYGSGKSFVEVMAVLAGGSMSLDQMMDLNQSATRHYCPRFYVPEPSN